jgi:DnaD/phage-associated family protein
MPSKYWIKLYHEMLHDPKMGKMSDHLYRRTIELFLMAGEEAKDGQLPSLDNMAWIFRVDPDELETDLFELQKVGILSSMNGEWYVTNFVKRQEPMDKSEYMQRKREENKREKYYQPVTNGNTEPDKIRIEVDTESEKEPTTTTAAADNFTQAVESYHSNIGVLTPKLADILKEAAEHYPPGWIPEAIEEAVKNNVRKWAYVNAILSRWETQGRTGKGKEKAKNYLGNFAEFIEH